MNGSEEILKIIATTFKVSGIALGISALLGLPFGALVGLTGFPGRRVVTVLLYTGMGFPPVVIGLAVYMALSRSGPVGELGWLFTPLAMVIAQIIIAFPQIGRAHV